jgi:hypothetical protein
VKTRRAPAVVVILAVLVAAWIVDSRVDRPRTKLAADVQTPMAARPGSRSSAWFCTGVTAAADAAANGTVVVANAGSRPLDGTVTVVPSEGDTKQVSLAVMAHGRAVVKLSDVVNAPYASTLVELDGGEAAVELDATGPLGESVSPCASAASTTWYLAEGVTTKDAAEVITLFNPFPEDAVVDMVFTTEEGEVTPQALTGLSVKGQGMAAINVGDYVQRREAVSAQITARAGRLVAGRLQTFDGSNGRKGMAVSLAAPAPGGVWYFPEGYLADGLTERFQLYNPSTKEAKAELDLTLEQGSAEPIVLTVPPQSRVTMTANDEARIPKSVAHAVTVRSTNGVPIVAERTIDATTPNTRSGLAITLGARTTASRWIVAAGDVNDTTDSWLVLQNAGSKQSRVTVTLLDDGTATVPPGLNALAVGAGQRQGVHLSDMLRNGSAALLVTADEPVVVESDFYKLKTAGTAMAPAIPERQ